MPAGERGGRDTKAASPAKFWLKSALIILLVGMLLAWVWTPSCPDELVYQGKPLRAWLKTYVGSSKDIEVQAEAVAAIRKIGTNGIPTLLRMIQASDSNLRTRLQALAEKQSSIKFNFADAESIRDMAMWGFQVLGEDAKEAVPELLTLAKKPKGTDGQGHAIVALGCIGPSAKAAVPVLMAIASDATNLDRSDAIHALGSIHSSPELVVLSLSA
ncbi:MAG: hypothetical protein EBS05_15760 [Proteobacteria bacterium]|nr:hypothetical protein [Pseudomonadota bacterium]